MSTSALSLTGILTDAPGSYPGGGTSVKEVTQGYAAPAGE